MKDPSDAIRKIRTIVVDDEPLARTNLTVLLRPHPELSWLPSAAPVRTRSP